MLSERNTYHPSGKISPLSLFIYLLLAITLIPLCGIIYSTIIWFMPIIYVNFLVTGGFGAVLGFLVYMIVRFGHVRSRKVEWTCMILVGLTGWYLSWCAHLVLVNNVTGEGKLFAFTRFDLMEFLNLVLAPDIVFQNMALLSEFGTWLIGSLPVNGIILIIIWVIELGLIILLIWKVNKKWSLIPYSEPDGRWCEKIILPKKLRLHHGISKFQEGLFENNITPILEAGITDAQNMEYTELAIFDGYSERESYLAFYNMVLSRDRKGNKTKIFERISDFFVIGNESKKRLQQHFGNNQAPKPGSI